MRSFPGKLCWSLMPTVSVGWLGISLQAHRNENEGGEQYPNDPYAGHARVLCDGGAAGRAGQRSVYPQDEGRLGMLRTVALASVN